MNRILILVLLSLVSCYASACKEYDLNFDISKSFKQNIAIFAEKNGWQLVWQYDGDFPVLAESKFTTTLGCGNDKLTALVAQIKETGEFGTLKIQYDISKTSRPVIRFSSEGKVK